MDEIGEVFFTNLPCLRHSGRSIARRRERRIGIRDVILKCFRGLKSHGCACANYTGKQNDANKS